MKSLTTYINEKMVYNKSTASKYNYHPKTKEELQELLKKLIEERGNKGNFNDIDTSEITDMSFLFYEIEYSKRHYFNGDISKWNVSNVTNMQRLFYFCNSFNNQLNDWDVSNVTNMEGMFFDCGKFNKPLNDWDVSNTEDMGAMFSDCKSFNQDISQWNVSKVTNMDGMFCQCKKFNQDLSSWNVSKVTNSGSMFYKCPIEEKYKPKFK